MKPITYNGILKAGILELDFEPSTHKVIQIHETNSQDSLYKFFDHVRHQGPLSEMMFCSPAEFANIYREQENFFGDDKKFLQYDLVAVGLIASLVVAESSYFDNVMKFKFPNSRFIESEPEITKLIL